MMIIILNSRNCCVEVGFEIKCIPEILNIQVPISLILTQPRAVAKSTVAMVLAGSTLPFLFNLLVILVS